MTTAALNKARRRRRSYHTLGYRAIMRLPMGFVPEVCRRSEEAEAARRWERRGVACALVALSVGALMAPVVTYADVIRTTLLALKDEVPATAPVARSTAIAVYDTETFETPAVISVGAAAPIATDTARPSDHSAGSPM